MSKDRTILITLATALFAAVLAVGVMTAYGYAGCHTWPRWVVMSPLWGLVAVLYLVAVGWGVWGTWNWPHREKGK